MSIQLDKGIEEKLNEINENGWLKLGYKFDSRDNLELVNNGNDGLDELKLNLNDSDDNVSFNFIKLNEELILLIFLTDLINGVKRARALVHGRSLSNQFQVNQNIVLNSLEDFNAKFSSLDSNNQQSISNNSLPQFPQPPTYSLPIPPNNVESATTVQSLDDDDDDDDTDSIVNGYQDANENDDDHKETDHQLLLQQQQQQQQQQELEHKKYLEQLEFKKQQEKLKMEEEERKRVELEQKRRKEIEDRRRAEAAYRQHLELQQKRRAEMEESKQREIQRQKALEQDKLNKLIQSGGVALSGKLSALTKSGVWRRRYFELNAKALLIYNENKVINNNPIQYIPLNKSTAFFDNYDELLVKHSIKITTQSDELFVYLDSNESKLKLLNALNSAIKH